MIIEPHILLQAHFLVLKLYSSTLFEGAFIVLPVTQGKRVYFQNRAEGPTLKMVNIYSGSTLLTKNVKSYLGYYRNLFFPLTTARLLMPLVQRTPDCVRNGLA